ncbi:hypothetical protein AR273_17820 [Stenotrophomonas maltophilia]|nr:hypothetical protein AR273_17820 [Stenotrophomonas maltophilia]
MRITFDGAGDGLGQEAGATGGEVVAQLETTSAQVSHNSSRDGRGRSSVFFMLCSNGGQCLGLGMLGGTGLVDLRGDRLASAARWVASLPSARSLRQVQPTPTMAPDQRTKAAPAMAKRFTLILLP